MIWKIIHKWNKTISVSLLFTIETVKWLINIIIIHYYTSTVWIKINDILLVDKNCQNHQIYNLIGYPVCACFINGIQADHSSVIFSNFMEWNSKYGSLTYFNKSVLNRGRCGKGAIRFLECPLWKKSPNQYYINGKKILFSLLWIPLFSCDFVTLVYDLGSPPYCGSFKGWKANKNRIER